MFCGWKTYEASEEFGRKEFIFVIYAIRHHILFVILFKECRGLILVVGFDVSTCQFLPKVRR